MQTWSAAVEELFLSKRRLILMRHAKSAWPADVADRERPLNARGRSAAPAMGLYLASENLLPDLAIVSPAKRTRQTWAFVSAQFGRDIRTDISDRLYDAAADDILDVLRACPPDAETVLILGHNPGLGDLAVGLCDVSAPVILGQMREKFPTAAVAIIDFDFSTWRDLEPRSGQLQRFVLPRSLG